MSLQSHLSELVRRHQALQKEIERETLHVSGSDLRLVELKRKKLLLKDEIQRLKDGLKPPSMH